MSSIFTILSFGFLLGLRHATDADHIAAITAITSKEENITKASSIGILWGIGHSISVTLVAIPIILFSITIPPNVTLGFEFLVGIMLVTLGLATIAIHSHTHRHENHQTHTHEHAHFLGLFHNVRPFIVGLVHGLAGSAAIALLVLSTIKNPILSVLYLFIFHIGVIVGMMTFTTLLGKTIIIVKNRNEILHKYIIIASGIISFLFGFYIIYNTKLFR